MALDLKEHGRRRQKRLSAKGIALKVSSDGTSTLFLSRGRMGSRSGSVRKAAKDSEGVTVGCRRDLSVKTTAHAVMRWPETAFE